MGENKWKLNVQEKSREKKGNRREWEMEEEEENELKVKKEYEGGKIRRNRKVENRERTGEQKV